jgi:hypothetical protein
MATASVDEILELLAEYKLRADDRERERLKGEDTIVLGAPVGGALGGHSP